MTATALKIIDIGDENVSETMFTLCKDDLARILDKIPSKSMKVSIVSIVGAFRTGKSFLLNFFLRYLRYAADNGRASEDDTEAWLITEGEDLKEGNQNVKTEGSEKNGSFAWRGGNERLTTGIWMWSEPFIIHSNVYNEDIAVLLMDTQGMFDNQTTMTLTAQIFGLSTLVSSFQIYNVEKRIGEDNLQHLALFSEYGRMAMSEEIKAESANSPRKEKSTIKEKPFQRLQFLIRDYQNFDSDFDEEYYSKTPEEKSAVMSELRQNMNNYLKTVIEDKAFSDLQTTRDQINRCFETIDCFALPHPGQDATKKNYSGSIKKLDPFFRALLNVFVREVFDKDILAKQINGRFITSPELQNYFDVYVSMFQIGRKSFPQAMTMLEATAEANNRNALSLATVLYKSEMDEKLRPVRGQPKFFKETELTALHDTAKDKAVGLFDEMATMGSEDAIAKHRLALLSSIEDSRVRYFEVNSLQNPFRDVEKYVVPFAIGIVAYIGSRMVDRLCSTDFCENTEDALERIYMLVFFLMFVMAWRYLATIYSYAKEILPLLMQKAKTS